MSFHTSFRAPQATQSKRGFTLLQLLVVIGILAVLSAVLFGALGRASEPARRAKCDVHLKQIALALATFRQERSRMPKNIAELVDEGYVSKEILVCPSDATNGVPRGERAGEVPDSYADFYVLREPRDGNGFPVIVCPFHEKDGGHGLQGFKGGSTEQFAARPATVNAADIEGVVTITRPQEGVLALPTGNQVLPLRGGDHIKTGSGSVTLHFADTSTASIQANTELSVLESYVDGQRGGSLYTLVRQFTGRCNYYVKPGNRFDVGTPTATAGALGTRFTIDLTTILVSTASPNVANPAPERETIVAVQEHTVALTTVERTIWVIPGDGAVAAHDPKNLNKPRTPRGSQEEAARQALTNPASAPTGNNVGGDGNNGDGNGGNGGNGNGENGGDGNSGNGGNGNGGNGGNGNGGNGNSNGNGNNGNGNRNGNGEGDENTASN